MGETVVFSAGMRAVVGNGGARAAARVTQAKVKVATSVVSTKSIIPSRNRTRMSFTRQNTTMFNKRRQGDGSIDKPSYARVVKEGASTIRDNRTTY